LPYYLAPVVFLSGVLSEIYYGNFFIIVWIPYVLLPILDYVLPVDHSNVPENRVRILEKDKRFLTPLYVIWVMDFVILFWSLYKVSIGEAGSTPSSFILWALCTAQPGAVNAAVGHELFHRRNLFDKVVGTLSYAKMFYGHNFIAHIRCHHKKVATPEDP
jgi:alkane 1-monooxygenase